MVFSIYFIDLIRQLKCIYLKFLMNRFFFLFLFFPYNLYPMILLKYRHISYQQHLDPNACLVNDVLYPFSCV
jgi:hypothetical protein